MLAVALDVPLGIYMIVTTLKFIPVSRNLRLHRIQPSSLMQKINDGDKVLILDLLGYEEGFEAVPGIPSARLDFSRVREVAMSCFLRTWKLFSIVPLPALLEAVLWPESKEAWRPED